MALLGNYSVILKNPATFIGGTQVSNCRSAFNQMGQNRQRYYPETTGGLPTTSSLPGGTRPPYSYLLEYDGGGLSSMNTINSSATANGNMGVNIDSIANIAVTAQAVLQLVASLSGNGTITFTSTADGFGSASSPATASISVLGTVNVVGVGGLLAQATIAASSTADIQATGSMDSMVYLNQSEATVQQIVDAVLNAIAAEYNLPGTIGEAINGAGSAGNPWITDLSSYNTANTAGKILKDRLSKNQFLGLK